MEEKIKLPEIPYRERLIYFIERSHLNAKHFYKTCELLQKDQITGKFFKYTGNQWNESWDWIGLQDASVDKLEQVYERLYGKANRLER